MKTTRFTTAQIIGVMKKAEAGLMIKELCRKHGVSDVDVNQLECEIYVDRSDL